MRRSWLILIVLIVAVILPACSSGDNWNSRFRAYTSEVYDMFTRYDILEQDCMRQTGIYGNTTMDKAGCWETLQAELYAEMLILKEKYNL